MPKQAFSSISFRGFLCVDISCLCLVFHIFEYLRVLFFAMAPSSEATFTVKSYIRGYHMYKNIADFERRQFEIGLEFVR